MKPDAPIFDASHFRVARPTSDIAPLRRFYVDGLGLEPVGEFWDHDVFDGLIVRQPGTAIQIEFTVAHGQIVHRAADQDHLVVFYISRPVVFESLIERMRAHDYRPVRSFNPYWDRHGVTYEDADGYRVVLVNGTFPPSVPSNERTRRDAAE